MRRKPPVVKDSKAKLEKFASDGNKWYKKCQTLVSCETTKDEDSLRSVWAGEISAHFAWGGEGIASLPDGWTGGLGALD